MRRDVCLKKTSIAWSLTPRGSLLRMRLNARIEALKMCYRRNFHSLVDKSIAVGPLVP